MLSALSTSPRAQSSDTCFVQLTGYTVLCGSPALFVVGFLDILTLVGAVIYDSSVCTEHLLMVPTHRSERL